MARSEAGRFWRHISRGISTAHGLGFCRLLPRAFSDFMVPYSARNFPGSWGHINDRLWQVFWDFVFLFSNFLLAILFGAAAGNLVRGVPLDAHGNFSMAFFTDFNVRVDVGLLDWYTVSMALFATVILAAHGATYLTLKTGDPVHDRSAT